MTWQLIKRQVIYRKLSILQITFWLSKFVVLSHDLATTFIISSYLITKSSVILFKYILILQVHVLGFQVYYVSYTWCFIGFWHSHCYNSLFRFWFELNFQPKNLHLQAHKICFVKVPQSFILLQYLRHLKLHFLHYSEHIFFQKNYQEYYNFAYIHLN